MKTITDYKHLETVLECKLSIDEDYEKDVHNMNKNEVFSVYDVSSEALEIIDSVLSEMIDEIEKRDDLHNYSIECDRDNYYNNSELHFSTSEHVADLFDHVTHAKPRPFINHLTISLALYVMTCILLQMTMTN